MHKRNILLIAFVACLALATLVLADDGIPQCRVNTVPGFHVDLNPLKASKDYSVTEGWDWEYHLNICGAAKQKCEDKDGDVKENLFAMQSYVGFSEPEHCFALSGDADKPAEFIHLEPVNTEKADKGVVMKITGGAEIEEGAAKGNLRSVEITFQCDEEAEDPVLEFDDEDTDEGIYKFTMTTEHACDKEGSVSGSGGFDWAWFIFFPGVLGFIMLFALIGFVLYMIIGVIVNKKKFDKSGLELIPNSEFWRNLPGLWKDGVLLIKNIIMSIVYKITKRGAYQSLDA